VLNKIADGTIPYAVPIGDQAVAWVENEVPVWSWAQIDNCSERSVCARKREITSVHRQSSATDLGNGAIYSIAEAIQPSLQNHLRTCKRLSMKTALLEPLYLRSLSWPSASWISSHRRIVRNSDFRTGKKSSISPQNSRGSRYDSGGGVHSLSNSCSFGP